MASQQRSYPAQRDYRFAGPQRAPAPRSPNGPRRALPDRRRPGTRPRDPRGVPSRPAPPKPAAPTPVKPPPDYNPRPFAPRPPAHQPDPFKLPRAVPFEEPKAPRLPASWEGKLPAAARFAGGLLDRFGPWIPLIPWTTWSAPNPDTAGLPDDFWDLHCDTGLGPQTMYRRAWPKFGCGQLSLQTVSGYWPNFVYPRDFMSFRYTATATVISTTNLYRGRSQVDDARMVYDQAWERSQDADIVIPYASLGGKGLGLDNLYTVDPRWIPPIGTNGVMAPMIEAGPLTSIDPVLTPIYQPVDIRPLPLHLYGSKFWPKGTRDPLESNLAQYHVSPRPQEPVAPSQPYDPWPSVDIEIIPNAPPRAGTGSHFNRPPGKGEKEKKAKYRSSLIPAFLEAAAEANDFISALYKAIPSKYRRWKGRDGKWRDREITPGGKLLAIYANWHHVDLGDALQNLVENEIEDRAIGGLNRWGQKSYARNPYYKRPFGYGAGPAM